MVDAALLEALADADPSVRAIAVRAVGRIGDAAAPSRLEAALTDPSAEVRAQAVFGLGIIGSRASLGPLRALAEDPEATVRARVADALGRLPDPASHGALLKLLADPSPEVRSEACLASWKMTDATFAVDALLDAVRSEEPAVRFGAAYALGRLGAAGIVDGSPSPSPGALSADAFERVRARLADLVLAAEAEVRLQVARGLASPRNPVETAVVGALARDPDGRVRVNAIRSLSVPGRPLPLPVENALKDADAHVVRTAVEGLGRIGGNEAVRKLLEGLIREKRPWMLQAALAAMAQASPADALGFSETASEDPDAALRLAAIQSLVDRREPAAIALGAKCLQDTDVAVQAAAVPLAARAKGSLAAILAPVIASPDPVVRAAVADAVGDRFGADPPEAEIGELHDVLVRLWDDSLARGDAIVAPRIEILEAAARNPDASLGRSLLDRGISDPEWIVRRRSAELFSSRFREDRLAAVGPAVDLPLDHYVKVLAWASTPRAAVVTVRRPGFRPARFTVALDAASAPLAAWNFARLADDKFFDGRTFHRVVPNFVVQDGDPRGDGHGGPGYAIRDEIGTGRFWAGTVGMASSGKDTAGSQWFVTLSAQPHLDGRYTAFGVVVQNLAGVVMRFLPGDVVESVVVYEGDGTEPLPPL